MQISTVRRGGFPVRKPPLPVPRWAPGPWTACTRDSVHPGTACTRGQRAPGDSVHPGTACTQGGQGSFAISSLGRPYATSVSVFSTGPAQNMIGPCCGRPEGG